MENIPKNFFRASIKALILDDKNRFLLCLENNGLWEAPGGGLDYGETPHECLFRELKEEAGLEVTFMSTRPAYFISALHTNGQWKTNVFYETKVNDLNFTPSDECVELRFFTKKEALKEKLTPITRIFVNEYNPENHRSESTEY